MKREHVVKFPESLSVTVYDGEHIPTEEGYLQKRMHFDDLDWQWCVNPTTGECVRAVALTHPIRIMGLPAEVGATAAFDIDSGVMLVHSLTEVFTMDLDEFGKTFEATKPTLWYTKTYKPGEPVVYEESE